MKGYKLFSPDMFGPIKVRNRIVMAPMTRCRAIRNLPNELMAEYYKQRACAGLIITEGITPSPNGLGYARIPGIFNVSQVDGWKRVTSAVHEEGGKIFAQLMHTGRMSHPLNMPAGSRILAPSAVKPTGQMWTDEKMMQDFPVPLAMTDDDLLHAKTEYVDAALYAIEAGFDGVELHGANGYLLEQFLSPVSNVRKDRYGGSIENRCRFVIEVADVVAEAIGNDKTAIRLSPYGTAGDMPHYPEIEETYKYLAERLINLGIAYLHLVDHSALGAPTVPGSIKELIRNIFTKTIILSGGYSLERAESDLQTGSGNLIAFGRPFINNPDLVERFMNNWPLSTDLFYTSDENGYTDYPPYKP